MDRGCLPTSVRPDGRIFWPRRGRTASPGAAGWRRNHRATLVAAAAGEHYDRPCILAGGEFTSAESKMAERRGHHWAWVQAMAVLIGALAHTAAAQDEPTPPILTNIHASWTGAVATRGYLDYFRGLDPQPDERRRGRHLVPLDLGGVAGHHVDRQVDPRALAHGRLGRAHGGERYGRRGWSLFTRS